MIAAITWAVRFSTAKPRTLWRKVPLVFLVRVHVAGIYLRAFLRSML